MADILLRGFEMPTDASLWLLIKPDGTVFKIKDNDKLGLPKEGAAIFLPEGHGRLIDADALAKIASNRMGVINIRHIDEAPTIVPAEGGGEDG